MHQAHCVTSWQSLLYCAAADVTIDRIRDLVQVTGTESLTVEFKEGGQTSRVAECAAAMANTHGGLIFIGITDQEREIVGVSREALAHVAGMLADRLDPPDWPLEMIEVPLDAGGMERYVLVIRINRDAAPRPVFVQAREGRAGNGSKVMFAPIRMPGSTRQATRDELCALFTEPRPGGISDDQWGLQRPEIPRASNGDQDSAVDFMLRSGLRVPVAREARGRPISQRATLRLATGLDSSPIEEALFGLSTLREAGSDGFQHEGPENRSNVATLVWRLQPGDAVVPVEMTVRLEAPGHYGRSHVEQLELQLTAICRLTAWLGAVRHRALRAPRILTIPEWAALLDSILATLTSPEIVHPVADLAGVDPVIVHQPRVLHLVSGPPIADLLPPLQRIRESSGSHGSHMLADPALDLSTPSDRAEQADRWLSQIGSDAGLLGMEDLIDRMRGRAAS